MKHALGQRYDKTLCGNYPATGDSVLILDDKTMPQINCPSCMKLALQANSLEHENDIADAGDEVYPDTDQGGGPSERNQTEPNMIPDPASIKDQIEAMRQIEGRGAPTEELRYELVENISPAEADQAMEAFITLIAAMLRADKDTRRYVAGRMLLQCSRLAAESGIL
jgi:hypothetical protein